MQRQQEQMMRRKTQETVEEERRRRENEEIQRRVYEDDRRRSSDVMVAPFYPLHGSSVFYNQQNTPFVSGRGGDFAGAGASGSWAPAEATLTNVISEFSPQDQGYIQNRAAEIAGVIVTDTACVRDDLGASNFS